MEHLFWFSVGAVALALGLVLGGFGVVTILGVIEKVLHQ